MTNIEGDRLQSSPGQTHADRAVRLLTELCSTLDADRLMTTFVQRIVEDTAYHRAILLLLDEDDDTLAVAAQYVATAHAPVNRLRHARIAWQPEVDTVQYTWSMGQAASLRHQSLDEQSPLYWLMLALDVSACFCLPLVTNDGFLGVVLAVPPEDAEATSLDADNAFLTSIMPAASSTIANAHQYGRTVHESAARMRQLSMLRQIDRELNDNIQIDHVFALTLDWALRYTNAQAASLAYYNEDADELRYVSDLGYPSQQSERDALRAQAGHTVAHRVARSGRTEVVPDVSLDKDYLPLAPTTRSQLVAPILREDRVIAVVCVESKKLNHFTDDHVDFIEKLGARAGVAIDNARLFWETARERAKLERILRNTADVVFVVDTANAIDIVNASALVAFGLDLTKSYQGLPLETVVNCPELLALYKRAVTSDSTVIGEVTLPNERTFYTNIAPCEDIGWIIIMHDISPLKKTDRLKSELIAAVSHDLKQPLGIMHGYAELLRMNAGDAEQIESLVPQIQRAIGSMQQLIDDQLDLARLEAGIQLHIETVYLRALLTDCIENLARPAAAKSLSVRLEMADERINVRGDRHCLYRIFVNLIGNAVKYTPDHGSIVASVEAVGQQVRVAIHDNGLGISPEDQTRVFDRFFRVRRQEYDGIDGTGLGLAIVKRLVELHHGQIGLTSTPGSGSTFTITLPVELPPEASV